MKRLFFLAFNLVFLSSTAFADPDFTAIEQQSPDMQQLLEVKATSSHTTTVQFWIKSDDSTSEVAW